ncbi:hypothetical protein ANCCAN_15472 [Ancylostoma caninum]|uniref:Uncharacterized protein n=1 Tax=Ancylostoma caninum TaxID=29170 RepID=A0A368G6L5_ANCCA|nr:hypothetical protein ANCCAN_15472 [Ancylostoma caninum]
MDCVSFKSAGESERTVRRIVVQWKSEGNIDAKRKPGRPPPVNTRRSRTLIKKRISGMTRYRLCQGQHLTKDAMQNRVARCKKLVESLKIRDVQDVL